MRDKTVSDNNTYTDNIIQVHTLYDVTKANDRRAT